MRHGVAGRSRRGLADAGVGVIRPRRMSPEQASRPAGKRSDVWAFGCVSWMLTESGHSTADVGETLAAVIKSEP
jgi:hypothetical protein